MSEQYKRFCEFEKTCADAATCDGPTFTLLARTIVKNKCWVVESDGTKVATILANDGNSGVTLVHDGQRERFSSLKLLSARYNIIIDKNLIIKQKHEIISKYLIRIIIKDKTQNLHNIIKCFENNKLNIKKIDTSINDKFEVIIITDFNYEYCLTSTINSLLHCNNVDKIVSVFRFL